MVPPNKRSLCEIDVDGARPTGWHSAAASALERPSKPNDLAREAVSCNRPCAGAHVSTAGTPIIAEDSMAVPEQRRVSLPHLRYGFNQVLSFLLSHFLEIQCCIPCLESL